MTAMSEVIRPSRLEPALVAEEVAPTRQEPVAMGPLEALRAVEAVEAALGPLRVATAALVDAAKS